MREISKIVDVFKVLVESVKERKKMDEERRKGRE
jgi:hypothetical protein